MGLGLSNIADLGWFPSKPERLPTWGVQFVFAAFGFVPTHASADRRVAYPLASHPTP
jgi:hypothetical protein